MFKTDASNPWYKNAFVFAFFGLMIGGAVLAADTFLVMAGFPDGLPEAVTTPVFGMGTTLLGYAGACITHRQQPPAATD